MRLLNLFLLLVVLAGGAAYGLLSSREAAAPVASTAAPPAIAPLPPGPSAPNFAFNNTTLASLKGRVVLLNFWASWCAPCVEEFPQFITLTKRHPNLTLLAVSVDHDRKAMQKFLDKMDIKGNSQVIVVEDPQRRIAQDIFQTVRYPETYLLGPDLTIRRKYVGLEIDWLGDDFAAQLGALGADSPESR